VLEGCTVAHVSNYALQLARGCRENRIAGCRLFDLGAGGIKIGEPEIRDDPAQQTGDNEIIDNEIHAGGRTFHQAVGIWIGQSFGNRIAHNEIHDLYYTGISIGWTWGYGKTLARDNLVEANHIHDLGQGWLSDLGGIYTLGIQPGTVIRGNRFHDIAGYSYGGWGIYFDEGSTGIVALDNLVYRTTHGGFHQHYGKDNVVRNNIFALAREEQISRSRAEPHKSFSFEHNIVYFREGALFGKNWTGAGFALDSNLYWNAAGRPVTFPGGSAQQWVRRGFDRHSLIADPKFRDPDKGDFALVEDSPALKLGFKPFDVASAGPRPPAQRR
jgi:Right handed beta helix region